MTTKDVFKRYFKLCKIFLFVLGAPFDGVVEGTPDKMRDNALYFFKNMNIGKYDCPAITSKDMQCILKLLGLDYDTCFNRRINLLNTSIALLAYRLHILSEIAYMEYQDSCFDKQEATYKDANTWNSIEEYKELRNVFSSVKLDIDEMLNKPYIEFDYVRDSLKGKTVDIEYLREFNNIVFVMHIFDPKLNTFVDAIKISDEIPKEGTSYKYDIALAYKDKTQVIECCELNVSSRMRIATATRINSDRFKDFDYLNWLDEERCT